MLARERKKKKILASVAVLLVILLVATAIAYAGPAPTPFKEPKGGIHRESYNRRFHTNIFSKHKARSDNTDTHALA